MTKSERRLKVALLALAASATLACAPVAADQPSGRSGGMVIAAGAPNPGKVKDWWERFWRAWDRVDRLPNMPGSDDVEVQRIRKELEELRTAAIRGENRQAEMQAQLAELIKRMDEMATLHREWLEEQKKKTAGDTLSGPAGVERQPQTDPLPSPPPNSVSKESPN